ncbi:LPS export ABC transporter permease LptG [Altererythrobacter sp. Root672]|uniref:LPS export ABC transporter permease LptG n=1 Tax=Altererythrobacter sp. Root672 TaxID=1736584 RepID=UPI0006F80117|nr:LPS export ABC transporter permease LptG [Altererythrobacter sp. Root672]KRA82570.1 LPS export ABC transporter permease LptG [Altererythrobacter sp. Root672]
MQFDFFPSKTLTWYLGKTFLVRILAVLIMLVLVLMMLDLLSNTAKILAYQGNGQAEVLKYVGLRVPQLIARFLPYSVLLATILTLATFNQNSEVIAMKAAGLSAHQILAPLILVALGIAVISFGFNERVVTRASATLKAWEANDYGPVPDDPTLRANIYLNDGNDVLLASSISGTGKDTVMQGVSFYERDDSGMIVRQLRAPVGKFADPGWRLEGVRQFDVDTAEARDLAEPVVVAPGITLAQIAQRKVDPDAESVMELRRSIQALDSAGRRTAELKGKWWHKFSGPLSSVLMPLLGAVAGFGLARSGHLLARAIIGMALGFAFFVVDNAALAMGSFGGYPPLLAAWAPFVLFFLLGETVLIRTEE